MEIIGHILGFIALFLFIWSYQLREPRPLLLVQTAATALLCLQYFLIGAYSGFALNIVCIVRNILYYHRDKKWLSGWVPPVLLATAMAGVSLFSWEGYHSLLIILGLMINTVCMGVCNTQNLRKSVLLTCSMLAAYNVFVGSVSGFINESLSVASAVIGLIRFTRKGSAGKEEPA
ncbi:MAG: YgjV family protein [Clostridia bacterium]|nr:YgjV family protein [Clostridia bacterium]